MHASRLRECGPGEIGLWCFGHESQDAEKCPKRCKPILLYSGSASWGCQKGLGDLRAGLGLGGQTGEATRRGQNRRTAMSNSRVVEGQVTARSIGLLSRCWGRSGKVRRCELSGLWLDVPCISGEAVVLDCRRRRDRFPRRGCQGAVECAANCCLSTRAEQVPSWVGSDGQAGRRCRSLEKTTYRPQPTPIGGSLLSVQQGCIHP
ncbi:hypothetical protein LZ32DRAFT_378234 [Colletotrichum eremochloae]|nr:hypothetical protein LZ32DRAFT_378234 [Colletotrichum eremochloae]